MSLRRKRALGVAAALAAAAVYYAWALWYYGGLYRKGALLKATEASAATLTAILGQNAAVSLPILLMTAIAALILRRDFAARMGFKLPSHRAKASTAIGALAYLALLGIKIAQGGMPLPGILYVWAYYLVWIALMEELLCRAILPELLKAGGLPAKAVWLLPAVLFALLHTLMPAAQGQPLQRVLAQGIFGLCGYALGGCGFYALRQWSGTLWLPVFVHAALDLTATLL